MNREVCQVSKETMEMLRQHDWPGNIRELQNVVERAVIMSSGSELQPPPVELQRLVQSSAPLPVRTLVEAERAHILEALRQVNWIVAGRNGAASRLGLPRTTLIYRMRKLGIRLQKNPTVPPFLPASAFPAPLASTGPSCEV
jgi:formate hydrogenlyase transcriptional activator